MEKNILNTFIRKVYHYFVKPASATKDPAVLISTTDNDRMQPIPESIKNFITKELHDRNSDIKLVLTHDKDTNLQTAKWLAAQQQKQLYKIDLGRLVSKYSGETEKNLSRLFDNAESKGWILFFDEADALFGKRSEVKDAHDRYANVEIAYLETRIQQFKGTVLINCITRDCREWKAAGLAKL